MSTIIWKYIDKLSVSVNALRDYDDMKSIMNSAPEDLKETYYKMFKPNSVNLSSAPKQHNPQATEDKIVSFIDKLDILQERYVQAVEYMRWFAPAWEMLSENEKCILREYYMNANQRSGANYRLQNKLTYSQPQIERLRKKALNHLAVTLFGCHK